MYINNRISQIPQPSLRPNYTQNTHSPPNVFDVRPKIIYPLTYLRKSLKYREPNNNYVYIVHAKERLSSGAYIGSHGATECPHPT